MGLNSLLLLGSSLLLMLFTGLAVMQKSVQLAKSIRKKDAVFKRTIVTILIGFFAFSALGIFVMFGLTSWSGKDVGLPPLFLIFQSLLCVTTIMIATAASYGRLPARIYIYLALFISIILYPLLGGLAWRGTLGEVVGSGQLTWLTEMGFRDIAGATLIHSVAGWVALATLIMFGLRKKAVADVSHKLGLRLISALLISVGMFAIIAVMSSLHVSNFSNVFSEPIVRTALTNALYASFTALVVAVLASLVRYRRLHVRMCTSAFIAGLVAISGSAFAVGVIAAAIIGAVAALLMMVTASIFEALNISDALNIVPTHLVAGIWGSIAVGIFANTELIGSQLTLPAQLAVQFMGIAFYGLVSFLPTCILLWLLAKLNLLGIETKASKEIAAKKASTLFSTLEEEARARRTLFKENVKATQALSVLTSYDTNYDPKNPNQYKEQTKKNLETNFNTALIRNSDTTFNTDIIVKGNETDAASLNKLDTPLKIKNAALKSTQEGEVTKTGRGTRNINSTESGRSTRNVNPTQTGRSTRNVNPTNSGIFKNRLTQTSSTPVPSMAIAEQQLGFKKRYPNADIKLFIEMLEDEVKTTKPANYTTSLVLSNLSSLRHADFKDDSSEKKANNLIGSDILGMQMFCTALADSLSHAEHMVDQITAQFVHDIYFASALYRISTLGVDEELLADIGDFDSQDYADLQEQSILPVTLIEDVSKKSKKKLKSQSLVQMCMDIAMSHQERWDGAGQPKGLIAEAIPVSARIINLVDSYINLRSNPVKILSHPRASQDILMKSMKQFDPVMVHHFFRINDLFEENYKDNFSHLVKGKFVPPTVEKVIDQKLTNGQGEVINPQNTMELLMDL